MAIARVLEYLPLGRLRLDPLNPRLGRDKRRTSLDQDQLLAEMSLWTLDELVDSFIQAGGFWTQDALIAVPYVHDGQATDEFVVVEGNRRLAALKLMHGALSGTRVSPRWLAERLAGVQLSPDDDLFADLPVLVADSRDDVTAYLGFRHVTGIKEWRPAEKAEFIAGLVDDKQLTFQEVARQIGSRSDTVQKNYTAFKMLLQMEEIEGFDWTEVEDRFSLLLLAIRSEGTRDFLGVELGRGRPAAAAPIPADRQDNARQFTTWLFGTKERRPIVRDSRNVDRFGEILATPRAVQYLQAAPQPDFETAFSLTATTDLVVQPLGEAARNMRLALSELDGRGQEAAVQEAAWPVIESSITLAQRTGPNLGRAQEMLGAA